MTITISITGSILRSTMSNTGNYYFDQKGSLHVGTPPRTIINWPLDRKLSVEEESALEEAQTPVVFSGFSDSHVFTSEATFETAQNADKGVGKLTEIFRNCSVEDVCSMARMELEESGHEDSLATDHENVDYRSVTSSVKDEELSRLMNELNFFLAKLCVDLDRFKYSGQFKISRIEGQNVDTKVIVIQTHAAITGMPGVSSNIKALVNCAREIIDDFSDTTNTALAKPVLVGM